MSGVKGQGKGNQNARRVAHPRLVISFSSKDLKPVYEKLARLGEPEPDKERVKEFIKQIVSA